jgi:hypothetical protein
MLFSIYEFSQNRRSEGRSFLTGVTEITFTRLPWKHSESKERLGKVCVELRRRVHRLQFSQVTFC